MSKIAKSLPGDYAVLLAEVKARVRSAQLRATLAANYEMVLLYWDIGQNILERQAQGGWGAKIVDRLAHDLKTEFPEMRGFSPRNLKYMRAFAAAWPERTIVQGPLAQITWYHHIALLERLDAPGERLWYARKTVEHGWSRNILAAQIDSALHKREGKAISNFVATLPPSQSDLAVQALKDPYIFDFLTLGEEAKERDIERGLMEHIQKFLLELGIGFAFIGRQIHIEVAGKDYYIDLLFYHLKLRCFVIIDLKTGPFLPEYAGKMNFYLSAVDDLFRHPDDQPSIGLLLCRDKDHLTVEYALRGVTKPIGVAAWKTRLVESLPKKFKGQLPAPEDIAKLLGDSK